MRFLVSLVSLTLAFGLRQKVAYPGRKSADTLSDDAFIQYIHIPDHSTIAQDKPECNFYEARHQRLKVPDSCCEPDAWPAGSGAHAMAPDARTAPNSVDGEQYSCYVRERFAPNNGTYIRNFFGCWKGNIQANEGCNPLEEEGATLFNGYPMNEADAVSHSENGDPESCNCDKPAYAGQGCYVALTAYMMLGVPDPTAKFVKLSGTCPADHTAEKRPPKPSLSYLTIFGEGDDVQEDVAAELAKVPECNYQGLGNDTYRVVDASCCLPETWTKNGVPKSKISKSKWAKSNGDKSGDYTCPVASLGIGGSFTGFDFVRGFQGCNGAQISASEMCIPDGIDMETGWPMSEATAEKVWEHGDYASCGCKKKLLIGDQCYIGATFPGMAFFGKSTGDDWCAREDKKREHKDKMREYKDKKREFKDKLRRD